MSATGRGAVRVEKDFYPTPDWVTESIAPKVNWERVHLACEPCVGSGAIPNALLPWYQGAWSTFEIREGRDYLEPRAMPWEPVDLNITNPPYGPAADFLKRALDHSACVSFLLRINFLGSEERREFLSIYRPTHLYTLSKRPSFVDVCEGFPNPDKSTRIKGCGAVYQKADKVKTCPACGGHVKAGTDATEYAWICWDQGQVMAEAPGIYFLPPPSPKGSLERSERVPHPVTCLFPTPSQEPQR
jgi:hypothetical protein